MAVNRQSNFLGQQRIDIPHLRALESSVCYDFDAVGLMLSGGVACVVKGFDVVNYTTCIGNNASTLVIKTAGSLLCHPEASDSGSFFRVKIDRADEILNSSNARIQGSWTPGVDNYVGVDLVRGQDSTTTDTVRFTDTTVDTESDERVPLARTLDYMFYISTIPFSVSPNICPLNVVSVNTAGAITAIKDARNLLFRMADGGDVPASNSPYGWPGGRNEGNVNTAYVAGDRSIKSLKDWMSAATTRLQELAGGEYWYSLTADRNVRLAQSGTFTSTGESFEWVSSNLHWKGLKFVFDNSTGHINEVKDQLTDSAGLTNLVDGDCIYVDLNRSADSTGASALLAQKAALVTLGGSSIPGQRWVIAYRIGANIYVRDQSYPVGASLKLATTAISGTLKTTINKNGDDTTSPIAVGLGDSATGYYTATCGGLSHNLDLGVTCLLPHNDIVVGRGTAAGDDSIYVQTNGAALGTVIYGKPVATSFTGLAALRIIQGDLAADSKIAIFAASKAGGDTALPSAGGDDSVNKVTIYNDGSISMAPVVSHPAALTGGNGSPNPARNRMFFRADKIWLEPCRCLLKPVGGSYGFTDYWLLTGTHTWTSSGTGQIYGANGVTPIALANGDRVLVWKPVIGTTLADRLEPKYHGIYEVVDCGYDSGTHTATHAVIRRTADANSAATIFQGISTSLTEGDYAGTSFKLITPTPITIDSTSLEWVPTDAKTRDQLCVEWKDGSVTAVCQSPVFDDAFFTPLS